MQPDSKDIEANVRKLFAPLAEIMRRNTGTRGLNQDDSLDAQRAAIELGVQAFTALLSMQQSLATIARVLEADAGDDTTHATRAQ